MKLSSLIKILLLVFTICLGNVSSSSAKKHFKLRLISVKSTAPVFDKKAPAFSNIILKNATESKEHLLNKGLNVINDNAPEQVKHKKHSSFNWRAYHKVLRNRHHSKTISYKTYVKKDSTLAVKRKIGFFKKREFMARDEKFDKATDIGWGFTGTGAYLFLSGLMLTIVSFFAFIIAYALLGGGESYPLFLLYGAAAGLILAAIGTVGMLIGLLILSSNIIIDTFFNKNSPFNSIPIKKLFENGLYLFCVGMAFILFSLLFALVLIELLKIGLVGALIVAGLGILFALLGIVLLTIALVKTIKGSEFIRKKRLPPS